MKEIFYHGAHKEFDQFDPARVGDRMTSLGLGHYLSPNISRAREYGNAIMAFEVDTADFVNWSDLTKIHREQVEDALLSMVPADRIAHFGCNCHEVLPDGKEGAKRYRELKEKTKECYNDYGKARVLTDDEIERYYPDLLATLKEEDLVVHWREATDLSNANAQQLMTLMNEYAPNLIKQLGFKGAMFSDQIALYDHRLATRVPMPTRKNSTTLTR
jgi:hypothetical protein